jgi:hypothetical protein
LHGSGSIDFVSLPQSCGDSVFASNEERMSGRARDAVTVIETHRHEGVRRDRAKGARDRAQLDASGVVVVRAHHVADLQRFDRATVNERAGRKALVDDHEVSIG